MSGIHAESHRMCGGRGLGKGRHSQMGIFSKTNCIGFSVQFDSVRTQRCSCAYESIICFDEQARPYAGLTELIKDRAKPFCFFYSIPPGIGGQDIGGVGDQRDLFGFHGKNKGYEIFRRVPFNIELSVDDWTKGPNIIIGNVTGIWPGVDGDSVCAPLLDSARGLYRTGDASTPRIAECGHFVDVDAQSRWESFHGRGSAGHLLDC